MTRSIFKAEQHQTQVFSVKVLLQKGAVFTWSLPSIVNMAASILYQTAELPFPLLERASVTPILIDAVPRPTIAPGNSMPSILSSVTFTMASSTIGSTTTTVPPAASSCNLSTDSANDLSSTSTSSNLIVIALICGSVSGLALITAFLTLYLYLQQRRKIRKLGSIRTGFKRKRAHEGTYISSPLAKCYAYQVL